MGGGSLAPLRGRDSIPHLCRGTGGNARTAAHSPTARGICTAFAGGGCLLYGDGSGHCFRPKLGSEIVSDRFAYAPTTNRHMQRAPAATLWRGPTAGAAGAEAGGLGARGSIRLPAM